MGSEVEYFFGKIEDGSEMGKRIHVLWKWGTITEGVLCRKDSRFLTFHRDDTKTAFNVDCKLCMKKLQYHRLLGLAKKERKRAENANR